MVTTISIKNFKKYPGNIFIHKKANISEDVKVGIGTIIYENVFIDEGSKILENCILRPNVNIGKNCEIHDGVELGYNFDDNLYTTIGNESIIRKGTVIYAGSTFENGFQTGNYAYIREKCRFKEHCSVGTFSQFEGYTNIGKYTRFHTNVHIGQHSEIGNYVWVFPYVVFTNDKYPPYDVCPPFKKHRGPIVKDYAIISTSSILLPGIEIGKDSIIGAGSVVTKDVPSGELWIGSPAKFTKKVEEIKWDDDFAKLIHIENPYPWRKFLKRDGYLLENEKI